MNADDLYSTERSSDCDLEVLTVDIGRVNRMLRSQIKNTDIANTRSVNYWLTKHDLRVLEQYQISVIDDHPQIIADPVEAPSSPPFDFFLIPESHAHNNDTFNEINEFVSLSPIPTLISSSGSAQKSTPLTHITSPDFIDIKSPSSTEIKPQELIDVKSDSSADVVVIRSKSPLLYDEQLPRLKSLRKRKRIAYYP
ncbi:hypothetical protein CANCADRAFT_2646 [Tortispora caseinolytica NRRL Y-17796]|uniref:Uncharacterized protein n=1 Tax=Tortispora caseinolytica NRRL Y-17796 TaxID=767744 RepID=A0A1E4TGS6_9ASCO|nr:hypothetical protein CANCADRAFT_2646 [Tortispora caseinolytica NRRL Y-17796]